MSSLDLLCVWRVGAQGTHVTGRDRPVAGVSGLKKKTVFKFVRTDTALNSVAGEEDVCLSS